MAKIFHEHSDSLVESDKTSHYQQDSHQKGLWSLNTPVLFANINNSLLLANFSLQAFASFFSHHRHERKRNKKTVKFCHNLVKEVNGLIKKLAKTNAISMASIYEKKLLLDFQNELYTTPVSETMVCKEAVLHLRNRMCQRMDAQNVSKFKKFRFLNQFNEAIKDRFVGTRCYYINDFRFFQLNKVAVESEFL